MECVPSPVHLGLTAARSVVVRKRLRETASFLSVGAVQLFEQTHIESCTGDRHFVVLASYALLAATLDGVVDGKRLRSSQKALHAERHETFVDVNGGFVGTSKCVDGILYAQLLARTGTPPSRSLRFIREYCEEDIASLGVPEKDFKSSASKIWRQA